MVQAAAEAAAAAASVAVGSNGAAAAGMADFLGNPVPNCTQSIINVGHPTAAAIGAAGFVQHDHFASVQMLARSYDGEAATARLNGGGGSGYGFAYSSAMGAGHSSVVSGVGQIGGGQFLKPGTAGGDEQPTATQ